MTRPPKIFGKSCRKLLRAEDRETASTKDGLAQRNSPFADDDAPSLRLLLTNLPYARLLTELRRCRGLEVANRPCANS